MTATTPRTRSNIRDCPIGSRVRLLSEKGPQRGTCRVVSHHQQHTRLQQLSDGTIVNLSSNFPVFITKPRP